MATHLRSAFEIISGPLSQRMFSGMPCRHIASAKASITPRLLMRRATFSAKQVRLSLRQAQGEVVDQRQDAQRAPIVRLRLYEVEAPDVVAVERP